MKSRTNVLIALLCSILIAGTPFGSLGADKIPSPPSITGVTIGNNPQPAPVTPPGNDGLLSGMNAGNYKIPSGWTLVRTQDFENNTTPPTGEMWGMLYGTNISSERSHSGSKSLMNTYSHDQSTAYWAIEEGRVGAFTEIYLSFYEFIESQALFNDEFFVAHFIVNSPTMQEVVVDWFWAMDDNYNPAFNGKKASLYKLSQGNFTKREGIKSDTVPTGRWVQWEIHYRPNTPGDLNGFLRVYKDGAKYGNPLENQNLNGTVSMNNCLVQAGGTYTKLVWMTDSPTCTACSKYPGQGNDYCTVAKGWSGQKFDKPICSPTDPPLPSFKRYFDDIIVLKK